MGTPEHGWVGLSMACPQGRVHIDASRVPYDTVSDLAAALVRLARADAAGRETVVWNEEPDQLFTIFERRGDQIELQVERSSRVGSARLFSYTAPAQQVVEAFATAVGSLRSRNYEKAWGHPFPMAALEQLAALGQ